MRNVDLTYRLVYDSTNHLWTARCEQDVLIQSTHEWYLEAIASVVSKAELKYNSTKGEKL